MSRTTGNAGGLLRSAEDSPEARERGKDGCLPSQAQLLTYMIQWGLGCASDTGRKEQGCCR